MTHTRTPEQKFTAKATFTIKDTPRRRGPEYACTVEAGPGDGTFTLQVIGLDQDSPVVPPTTLRCAPADLDARVREHMKRLHPNLGFELDGFRPADEWCRFVGAEAATTSPVCCECKRPVEAGSHRCVECRPRWCLTCDRRNDNFPQSAYCSTCR